jgi:hypothetical protein
MNRRLTQPALVFLAALTARKRDRDEQRRAAAANELPPLVAICAPNMGAVLLVKVQPRGRPDVA